MGRFSQYIQAVGPRLDWMTQEERNDVFLKIAGGDREDRLWLYDYLMRSGWDQALSVPLSRLWAQYDEIECGRLLVSLMPDWWIYYTRESLERCVPGRATSLRLQAAYYHHFFQNYPEALARQVPLGKIPLQAVERYVRLQLAVQPHQIPEQEARAHILGLSEARRGDLRPQDFSISCVGEMRAAADKLASIGDDSVWRHIRRVDALVIDRIRQDTEWDAVRNNPRCSDYRKALEYWRVFAARNCLRAPRPSGEPW